MTADPEGWYSNTAEQMGAEAYDDLWAALRNPEVVHGMLEDYRAGLTVDHEADDLDRANGEKITCPILVGWSTRDDLENRYGDVVAIWQPWADDIRGVAIESGHHIAEEAPEKLVVALLSFFAPGRQSRRR